MAWTYTNVPGLTRVNGLGQAADVLYDTLQLRAWRIEASGVDLGTGIGSKIEKLMQEFGTTAALAEVDADTLVIIGDSHALNSDIIAKRADKVLGGTGALVNSIDGTGSGSTVAGTTAAPVTTAIVEVGSISSLFGLVST
jgi:hypothetical protein